MKEGLPAKTEKPKINFDSIKKALLIAIIAISSMQETEGQAMHASYVMNEKPEIESVSREVIPVTDAKALETDISNKSDTFEIKIANYYETDKPDISPENAVKISETVNEYLTKLNKANIKEFLANDIVLRVSCDPRHTGFKGEDGKFGNLELAEARAKTAQLDISNSTAIENFSNPDLTQEDINNVKKKFQHIKIEIPMTKTETGQGEDGVLDYHKVINRETGEVYTDADWESLNKPENEEKLLEAYKDFRHATLVLQTLDKHPKKNIPENPFYYPKKHKKTYILFDDSYSMERSKKYLTKAALENNETDIPVDITFFTSKEDTSLLVENMEEAAKKLENSKPVDDPNERAIDVIITKLQSIENDGQEEPMTVCTDEALQRVNKDKLEILRKIATEKNIDVRFSIRMQEWSPDSHKEEERIINIPLSTVEQKYQEIYDKDIKVQIDNFKNDISITQQQIDEQYKLLGQQNNQKKIKEIIGNISSLKKEIDRLKGVIAFTQTIDISDFTLAKEMPNKNVHMVNPNHDTTTSGTIVSTETN